MYQQDKQVLDILDSHGGQYKDMMRRAVRYKVIDVSEVFTASIISSVT
jgi:hypothetical protein